MVASMPYGQTAVALWLTLASVWPLQAAASRPPAVTPALGGQPIQRTEVQPDWLIEGSKYQATYGPLPGSDAPFFALENGLVRRTFWLQEGRAATVGLHQLPTDTSLIRAVQPEAVVTINGVSYPVGGVAGQPNHAYLKYEWLPNMQPAANTLQFVSAGWGQTQPRFPWKRVRHAAPAAVWPPPGVRLTLQFQADPQSPAALDFRVLVHYELYDGVPVFCKWIEVQNRSSQPLIVERFTSEKLSLVEQESRVESREGVTFPIPQSIHVETDFAFGGFTHQNANRHVVHWRSDPDYQTQVNYKRETPCLLVVEPTYGPAQTVAAGQSFESYRTFELIYDSSDRERRSLSLRRMYRTIAPWVTENPLMHHMRVAEPDQVRRAIDDAAAVGFEMVILSFGSGFDIEDRSPENLQRWREMADYARMQGIEIGGYSLLSSRSIGDGNDIVPPEGQTATHGNCPALTSPWGRQYYENLYQFFRQTGFAMLEHDGPYPGDVDVTPRPPWQQGQADSRWAQGRIANDFYRWCRSQGIYVNAPDYYFLNGTNKCGMGYREVNWSLPREMQLIHTRQNIFDGTWSKTPSMGWMFVPLSEYHGGGAAATIEPLTEHLDHYRRMMQSNLGLGVQACYRGPRLFDTPSTREMVQHQVDWFRQYRDILESDVIHGRRADGQDLDWMLHVNPHLEDRGMLLVYNPTDRVIAKTLTVNLYYTGLTNAARLGGPTHQQTVELNRDYSVSVPVQLPPRDWQWILIRKPD